MGYLGVSVYDDGLNAITSLGTRVDICTALPGSYAEATGTYSVGNKTGVSPGAPADRSGGGREVTIPQVTGGTVTGTDTAAYWAISDPVGEELLAADTISVGQLVTSGNTFSLTPWTVGWPPPA